MGASSSAVYADLVRDEIGDSAMVRVDQTLTLVALVACLANVAVCVMAVKRHARRVHHLSLQRGAMRLLLVGPVYSCLMLFALKVPRADFYLAAPVGFYEGYAFFCFYGMLASFADGEEKLAHALASVPGQPNALVYYPCGRESRVLCFGIGHVAVRRFQDTADLLSFLKGCVAQVMVVKPLSVFAMLLLGGAGLVDAANYCRLVSVASLWLMANAFVQLYHVTLPRIRGLGGEKIFGLLLVMVVSLIIQDVVTSILLLDSHATSATRNISTRLIFILTIIEFAAFSTLFYRLVPPERFAAVNWSLSSQNADTFTPPPPQQLSAAKFALMLLDPRTLFAVQRKKSRAAPSKVHRETARAGRFEHKEEEDYDETTSLIDRS